MAIAPSHDPFERLTLDPREILRLLETVPLLAEMATRERAVLAEVAEVARCARDVQLFGVGQEMRWWLMVLTGRVEESVRAPDGSWPVVREVAAGQCLALDCVLAGLPTVTQGRAVTGSTFIRVPVLDFQRLLRGHGAASIKLQLALHEELGRDLREVTMTMVESLH